MKRIKKIVFILLSIILGLILIFNIYNFISLKVLHKDFAAIKGYTMLEVVSGSMEPTIHVGDIIIINTLEKEVKENDIITFKDKEGAFVTHRVILMDKENLITKGDNNDSEDNAITKDHIVGKYVTKINGGGKILSSLKSPFTMVMIFIIGLLACILLSTDQDMKPILDENELEFQEFLKQKESPKKENKKEEKEKTSKKIANKKEKSDGLKNSKKTPVKKEAKKIEEKAATKKTTAPKKTTTTKKTTSSKKQPEKKKTTTKKVSKTPSPKNSKTTSKTEKKKRTATKSSKK